jgi:hypothetical protein
MQNIQLGGTSTSPTAHCRDLHWMVLLVDVEQHIHVFKGAYNHNFAAQWSSATEFSWSEWQDLNLLSKFCLPN